MARRSLRQFAKVAGCVLALLSLSWSDSLTLRDGRHIEGKYIGGSESMIGFVTNGAVQYFAITDVMAVVFGNAGVDSPLGDFHQNSFHRRLQRKNDFLSSGRNVRRAAARVRSNVTAPGTAGYFGRPGKARLISTAFAVPTGDRMYRLLATSLNDVPSAVR